MRELKLGLTVTEPTEPSGLVDRHLAFVDALRAAGVPVSLAEGVDAVAALSGRPWDDRASVRTVYAATVVKRQAHRPTFETVFELYFPALVGAGPTGPAEQEHAVRDDAASREALRGELLEALVTGDQDVQRRLAVEAVGRFGAMPGRGPGLAAGRRTPRCAGSPPTTWWRGSWPRCSRTAGSRRRRSGTRPAASVGSPRSSRPTRGAGSPRRRDRTTSRTSPCVRASTGSTSRRPSGPTWRRCDARVYPLARRLATRLAHERHARRRGPLDFRRTVRASISSGGVPLITHHRPRRPHRTELVVLCDVSGSVASFARFTLMLVFALREQFQQVRAFTFVDQVHEVTKFFVPGADVGEVLTDLAASTEHAARWGRTNYGRAFTDFAESFPHAIGPKTSLLVLGDARSNYSDLAVPVLRELTGPGAARVLAQPRAPAALGHR